MQLYKKKQTAKAAKNHSKQIIRPHGGINLNYHFNSGQRAANPGRTDWPVCIAHCKPLPGQIPVKNPAIITNFTGHRHEHLADSILPAPQLFARQSFKLIDDID